MTMRMMIMFRMMMMMMTMMMMRRMRMMTMMMMILAGVTHPVTEGAKSGGEGEDKSRRRTSLKIKENKFLKFSFNQNLI